MCENLEVSGQLGTEKATRCRVYEHRTANMPIIMLDEFGFPAGQRYKCGMGTDGETKAILTEGVGKGCSLQLKVTLDSK